MADQLRLPKSIYVQFHSAIYDARIQLIVCNIKKFVNNNDPSTNGIAVFQSLKTL